MEGLSQYIESFLHDLGSETRFELKDFIQQQVNVQWKEIPLASLVETAKENSYWNSLGIKALVVSMSNMKQIDEDYNLSELNSQKELEQHVSTALDGCLTSLRKSDLVKLKTSLKKLETPAKTKKRSSSPSGTQKPKKKKESDTCTSSIRADSPIPHVDAAGCQDSDSSLDIDNLFDTFKTSTNFTPLTGCNISGEITYDVLYTMQSVFVS